MSKYITARQFVFLLIFTTFFGFLVLSNSSYVYSTTDDDLEDEINKKTEELNEKKSLLEQIESKIKEISGSTYSLTEKVNLLNAEITKLQEQIDAKNIEIDEKLKLIQEKEDLLFRKKELFDIVSTELYMKSRHDNAQLLFSFSNLENLLQNLFIKKTAISILREDIEKISGEFTSLSEMKEGLEQEKLDLDTQKKEIDESYSLVVAERNKLQGELNKQIAAKKSISSQISSLTSSLSSLQIQLLYSRQGGTHVDPSQVTVGGNYLGSLNTFMSQAPSGYFGVFSIGAYTHRNGMSQWGARARAGAGQNYQQILSAYYPGTSLANSTMENITVKFCDKWVYGKTCSQCAVTVRTTTYNFENDYLYRLGEMPESFPTEALKAQAISARTYALNATNYGANSIWGDECGQVVAGQKTGTWKAAVDATRGVVMNKSGKVFSSQYAAVHGGWVCGWGNCWWDIYDSSKASDFLNTWDAKSEVSWIYKSWYRPDYNESTTVSSATCNRAPWLSPQEMADLVNAASRFQDLGATNKYADTRIIPIYDSCHASGSPYSHAEMRNVSSTKFTRVISAIAIRGNGQTSEIIFRNEDGRETRIPGSYFKLAYNVRAPGYLRIPQSSFVHIDIQKK